MGMLNRHHKRHKKHWINLFEYPRGRGEKVFPYEDQSRLRQFFRSLKERYHKFLDRDIVKICEWHHVEIHIEYHYIINVVAPMHFRKPKLLFSIREMVWTMRKCKKQCDFWLTQETPGMNPKKARALGRWSSEYE